MAPAMPDWSPEIVVDETLARRLIGARFPELPVTTMRLLGEGWDSTAWLVDAEWVFRFPRRETVIPGFRRELGALPQLAPALPLPVPVAVHRAEPTADFGWPWAGSRFLPGRELAEAAPDERERVGHGRMLGRFLRTLHDIDPAGVTVDGGPLPVDPVRRADMPFRVARTETQVAALERLGLWRAPASLQPMLERARRLDPPGMVTLAHGDLHVRHLLVSDDGGLAGVIDWIDVCRADPAIDLPLYWAYLTPGGREAFHEEYGPVDPDRLLRARALAISLWGALAEYAHDVGMEALRREALAGIDRAVAGLRD
jgi:aminoglycoside phosphotransferase (APT) family kinase protein